MFRARRAEGSAGEPAQRDCSQNIHGGPWVSETGATDEKTLVRGCHAAVLLVQVSANHVKSFCGSAPDSAPGKVQLDLDCASTWTSTVLPPDFSGYQSAHPQRPTQGCTGDHTRCFQICLPGGADSCPVLTTQPSEQQQSL